MSETIGFRKHTLFLGRNGPGKMAGINVSQYDEELYLAPITSKGEIGRACLRVPVDMAPAVAEAMLRVSGNSGSAAPISKAA